MGESSFQDLYTRAPVTKMVASEAKKPKPQQIVLPASLTADDMTAAHSVQNSIHAATTYKPNRASDVRTTYTAPITTFHPRGSPHATSVAHVNIPTNAIVSTYHPQKYIEATKPSPADNNKYSSHYNAKATPFSPTSSTPMRPNVKELLASIGLRPDPTQMIPSTTQRPTTTEQPSSTASPEISPELKELLASFGLLTNEQPPAHAALDSYQDEFQPIFPSSLRDESLHVNDFRPLPATLLPESIDRTDEVDESEEAPAIRSDDFSSFKPLPLPEDVSPPKDAELEELLKNFGLLDSNPRDSKAITAANEASADKKEIQNRVLEVPEENVEFLSPDLIQVLGDMGLSKPKKVASTPKADEATTTPKSNAEDYDKLHHLLDTIKELEKLNANLTEQELDKLNLRNFNLSDGLLAQGPDPVDNYFGTPDERKNEIKRRQSNEEDAPTAETTVATSEDDDSLAATTTASSATEMDDDDSSDGSSTTASTTSSTSTTTEESRNGNIKDLADSFGGESGLDPVADESLPPPKQNGFYFFADWNSFLEVGEDPDKVVVRFDPKVGDSRRFIPVKIP